MKRNSLLLVLITICSTVCMASPQTLPEGRVVIQKTAGLPITGTLFGHGETAVILASQGGTSESEWAFFAKALATAGFTALTLSSPDSQGDTVVLVGQAIRFLREQGFRRIACGGASNGASGCAFNATEPEVTGLLLVTYHGAANLSSLAIPKLFVVAEEADPWRATTEVGFKKAGDPKTLVLVPGTSFTGPSILEIDQGIKEQAIAFLKKCNGL